MQHGLSDLLVPRLMAPAITIPLMVANWNKEFSVPLHAGGAISAVQKTQSHSPENSIRAAKGPRDLAFEEFEAWLYCQAVCPKGGGLDRSGNNVI